MVLYLSEWYKELPNISSHQWQTRQDNIGLELVKTDWQLINKSHKWELLNMDIQKLKQIDTTEASATLFNFIYYI